MASGANAVVPDTILFSDVIVLMGIGRSKAYEMVAEGTFPLPVKDFAGRKRVSRKAYDRWLAEFEGGSDGESQRVPD